MRHSVHVTRHLASSVALMAFLGAISGVVAEFCDPYIDRQNQLQEGFRCPVKEIVPRYISINYVYITYELGISALVIVELSVCVFRCDHASL